MAVHRQCAADVGLVPDGIVQHLKRPGSRLQKTYCRVIQEPIVALNSFIISNVEQPTGQLTGGLFSIPSFINMADYDEIAPYQGVYSCLGIKKQTQRTIIVGNIIFFCKI